MGENRACELLFREHEALTEELATNEARGETRVNMHLTLVTAVIAGLVALSATDVELDDGEKLAVAFLALTALLAVGIALYARLLKRNRKTDGMILDLEEIRTIVRTRLDPDLTLQTWQPFKSSPRKFGGLVLQVALLNSIAAGALGYALATAARISPGAAAASALLAALVCWLIHYLVDWFQRHRDKKKEDQKPAWFWKLWRKPEKNDPKPADSSTPAQKTSPANPTP